MWTEPIKTEKVLWDQENIGGDVVLLFCEIN